MIMDLVLPIFKAVSVIFAIAAIVTGARGVIDPMGFSTSFGIPLPPRSTEAPSVVAYVALMGVRQLSTGIIILIFAYQNKWVETATVLAVIGVFVASTDAVHLAIAGSVGLGWFHALPGGMIAALSVSVLLQGDFLHG